MLERVNQVRSVTDAAAQFLSAFVCIKTTKNNATGMKKGTLKTKYPVFLSAGSGVTTEQELNRIRSQFCIGYH